MKINIHKIGLTAALLCVMVWHSCSHVDNLLPVGPKGDDGNSSYDEWVQAVNNGQLPWDKGTDLANYFLFLKGGKGATGTSAYDLWRETIASGKVPNPHKAGDFWPANQNTEADFWNFLSGANGQNPVIMPDGTWGIAGKSIGIMARATNGADAYSRWVALVKEGTIKHDPTKLSEQDFFRYLKGQDGVSPTINPQTGTWVFGKKDTGIRAAGDSAYELWKKEVEAGNIQTADGQPWNPTENKPENFYQYLKGRNGVDGKSAYQLWAAEAAAGNLKDLRNPQLNWNANETSVADFYRYLLGEEGDQGKQGPQGPQGPQGDKGDKGDSVDGTKGEDGLSVYEMWKKDLAELNGTADALTDNQTGDLWDVNKNTLDDFYRFISGHQGAPGRDGKPGEPGTPGQVVIIKKGRPNVIIDYYIQEYSEYINPNTAKVSYQVYTKEGTKAPQGTTVKGLPGLPDKVFTTDENGKFTIDNADLPDFQKPLDGWGSVAEVTVPGQAPQESARNTYVPNKMRVSITQGAPYLYSTDGDIYNYFYVKRQRNLQSQFEYYPSYLSLESAKYTVYEVQDPTTIASVTQTELKSTNVTLNKNGSSSSFYYTRPNMVFENGKRYKADSNWKKAENTELQPYYYTFVLTGGGLYGYTVHSNQIVEVLPYQAAPKLKSLTLVKKQEKQGLTVFERADGEFDFSATDLTIIPKTSTMLKTTNSDDTKSELYKLSLYTPEEVQKTKLVYMDGIFKSPQGTVYVSSNNNVSTPENKTFSVYNLYLGSTLARVSVDGRTTATSSSISTYKFKGRDIGVLSSNGSGGYKVGDTEISVTYREN